MNEERLELEENRLEILIYSWNAQASLFDEESGDILKDIDSQITKETKLIVVALQESPKPGSHFFSLILLAHLEATGFVQLRRSRLMGVGVTTYKGLQNCELRLRGLRFAIYARKEWSQSLSSELIVTESYAYCDGIYQYSYGKGGISFKLQLPNGKLLNFINAHLPFDASSLNHDKDDSIRAESLQWQNKCFINLWDQLVSVHDDHVVLIGDLNYRVRLWANEKADDLDYSQPVCIYNFRDELRSALLDVGSRLPNLMEGIDGRGPTFAPTAKLNKGLEDTFNCGKQNRRAPSWCDRILYTNGVVCENYIRFKRNKATQNSDHAAIGAIIHV